MTPTQPPEDGCAVVLLAFLLAFGGTIMVTESAASDPPRYLMPACVLVILGWTFRCQ